MTSYLDPIGAALGAWALNITVHSILLRMGLAVLFGAIIGCERATKRHAAGLRTFVLTAFASALVMILERSLFAGSGLLPAASIIAVAVLAVHSVLCNSKNQIRGLTTSVGLWACGILGLTIGAGYYTPGLLAFLTLLGCLSLLPPLEQYLKNRSDHFEVHIELTDPSFLQDFVTILRRLGMTIDDIERNPAYLGSGLSVYTIAMSICSKELRTYKTHREIIEALATLEYIRHVEEIT